MKLQSVLTLSLLFIFPFVSQTQVRDDDREQRSYVLQSYNRVPEPQVKDDDREQRSYVLQSYNRVPEPQVKDDDREQRSYVLQSYNRVPEPQVKDDDRERRRIYSQSYDRSVEPPILDEEREQRRRSYAPEPALTCPCYSPFNVGEESDGGKYYSRAKEDVVEVFAGGRLEELNLDTLSELEMRIGHLCKFEIKNSSAFSDIYQCDILYEEVPVKKWVVQ